jgi:metal-responsive CopG/Arc/MetJ family transcriptional regulator
MKQNKIELSIEIRTNILEELDSMLQGEQKRYEFLDEDD